jgi:hypothetical protein
MNPELLSQSKYTRTDFFHQETKKETERLMKQGGKVVDQVDSNGKVVKKGTPGGLTHNTARQIARKNLAKRVKYTVGQLGKSDVASSVSRKQRREEARKKDIEFKPVYNGTGVRTFTEVFGLGYERFNNKFVKIR